jgi:hypothetical protein
MSRKKKKRVTAKSWRRTGETIDRHVRSHMASHPAVSYSEALRAVFRREPRLLKAWNNPPSKDPLADLRKLSEFLNEERNEIGEERDRKKLRDILRPLKSRAASAPEVEAARLLLTNELSRLTVGCFPVFAGKMATLAMMFPFDHYGVVADALRSGSFSKFKLCPSCDRFFVTRDHRKNYCVDSCFRAHEAERVKAWRTKTGT